MLDPTSWKSNIDPFDGHPRHLTDAIESHAVTPTSTWNVSIAWTDFDAVKRIYSKPSTEYADIKRILLSSGDVGSALDLKIELLNGQSFVWLCQYNSGGSV